MKNTIKVQGDKVKVEGFEKLGNRIRIRKSNGLLLLAKASQSKNELLDLILDELGTMEDAVIANEIRCGVGHNDVHDVLTISGECMDVTSKNPMYICCEVQTSNAEQSGHTERVTREDLRASFRNLLELNNKFAIANLALSILGLSNVIIRETEQTEFVQNNVDAEIWFGKRDIKCSKDVYDIFRVVRKIWLHKSGYTDYIYQILITENQAKMEEMLYLDALAFVVHIFEEYSGEWILKDYGKIWILLEKSYAGRT